ncbi:NAD(P)H-dependent oxidoreductase [Tissierella sp.]|uniref:NAD(P)H-dependent oxidoreductase n=1 Tax=Tissierella sp. TaxID=41274 RepID=UPI00285D90E7|nr:NAD(P)H-dependent oxidoreductase [Tissierella sp.]MDR7855541.1 NAD(P)H-dependent oxidoreductase [Tissierella sp.]
MKHVIINLSPREKGSSKMLTNYFADRIRSEADLVDTCDLYSYLNEMDFILSKIKKSDCIIMIGPCYITSYPADTINLLNKMSSKEGVLHGQSLYGFIQGGMPYVHTHEHGLKLLQCFCEKEEVEYKGGYVMGGGAVLNGQALNKIIGAKKVVPAVNKFIDNIKNNRKSPEELYKNAAIEIPYVITKMMPVMMNKSIKRTLRKKGINYKVKSPYF